MIVTRQQELSQWIESSLKLQNITLSALSGDASFRHYYRFHSQEQSLIAVDSPTETQKNHEFVLYTQLLEKAGIMAPKVLAVDYERGFLCLNDLGDELLFPKLQVNTIHHWYRQALDLLPQLQKLDGKAAQLPLYDSEFIALENHIFSEWFIEKHLAYQLTASQKQTLAKVGQVLIENNLQQKQVPMHRDFHSRNLMLVDNEIAVIDFQDMVLGPITYDAVSLLRDCYCRWPDEEVEQLKRYYYKLCKLDDISWSDFSKAFDLTGMQRHIKAAGIFARLHHRDGKSGYLADIPRTLDYIIDVAKLYPELSEFANLVEELKARLVSQTQSSSAQQKEAV